MTEEERVFFQDIISAGAILAGFCSTFLAFRIEREAQYYRQPVLSYGRGDARDIYIGLAHLTSSFLLISLAAVFSIVFGFLLPLFALAGASGGFISPALVVGGLVAALVLLAGYFVSEMWHLGILPPKPLAEDAREWRRELPIVIGTVVLAVVGAVVTGWIA